jgi:hypothetical protein
MDIRRLTSPTLAFAIGILTSCSEPTAPSSSWQPAPPVPVGPTPVHLAVGNAYNWRITKIGFGTFFFSDEISTILDDSTINGFTYYRLNSGELLRSATDTVFVQNHGLISVYYRLNVHVGDVVPFTGHLVRVSAVDTQEVLGSRQTVITVLNDSDTTTNLVTARYASQFGIIRIETRDSLFVVTKSLQGARLGTTSYGNIP